MSPNMTCDAPASFCQRPTVAEKKEALELRKTMKPLLEKRRRARINDSLKHLKELILPFTSNDKNRYSKLEKADILEMTVRFLGDPPCVQNKNSPDTYKEGYKACLQRVSALLPKIGLERDASRQVANFIERSVASATTRRCLSCCTQSSAAFPHIQERLLSLKSSLGHRLKSGTSPVSAQSASQRDSVTVWRPW
ncbi:transcription factor HES-2-like [Syngnathoides biaculeatus]|uniref:transcription factor HES-2-like n=1 Tax=Syngnathoides biaculeatus TaxID=300417 RepID=UPI002ADD4309|nr:transcription factor HES-2-like [Syngnathoides biaculeatus]